MKFATAALALLSTVSAVKPNKSLLRQAVPVNKDGTPRQLANNNQNAFEINGLYSIQFEHCMSLTTEDENLFDANWVSYAKDGTIIAEKSFVLFNVCPTEYCSYDSADNLYMVDLATFMASTTNVEVEKKERYCEACREAQNYCTYGQNQYGEANNGQRALQNGNNVQYVDCDDCAMAGCFEEEQNGQQYGVITDQDVAEWIQGVSQCQQTGYLWNNQPLYLGYICNGKGTGAELGLFMDQDCTVYNSMVSFKKEAQNYNGYNDNNQYDHYQYAVKSAEMVQRPFVKDIDCLQTEWASPEERYNNEQNGQQNNGYYQAPEAAEACRIVENSVPMDSCGYGYGEYAEYREQGYEEYNAYAWYEPQLEGEDADNLQATCTVVKKFNGEYKSVHVYNDDETMGSGSFYDYSAGKKGGNGGKIFGWILFVCVAVGAVGFAVTKLKVKDSKREPLVSGTGALA